MPASLNHIHAGTPMGANLIADVATFRCRAPHAQSVHVIGDFNNHQRTDAGLLTRDDHGHWQGFIPGVKDRQQGEGHDVIVVAHLANFTRVGYRIGFPDGGDWRELFNSDVYENWVNAAVMGNGGRAVASPRPLQGFDYSAPLMLPANSLMIFAR